MPSEFFLNILYNVFFYSCATRYVLSVIYKYIICKMVAKYHNIQFIEANDLCSSKEIVHKPPKRNQSENIF